MDVSFLRWLLLLIFAITLLGFYLIYLYRQKNKPSKPIKTEAKEGAKNKPSDSGISFFKKPEKNQKESSFSEDDLIILSIDCRNKNEFLGSDVIELLTSRGLTLGHFSIFHRHISKDGAQRLVYSVINGVEPGNLDEEFKESTTPSIMFFINIDDSYDPNKAFLEMLETSTNISEMLGGFLCDSEHNILTPQTIEYLKDKIREKSRSRKIQKKR